MLGQLADVVALLRGYGIHLGDLSAVLARRYGDHAAVEDEAPTPGVHSGGMRTHVEVEDAVARLAAAHIALGTGEGDTVLVTIGNRVDVVLHVLALARVGAVAVPLNPRLTAPEVRAIAAATGANAAVVDGDVRGLTGRTRERLRLVSTAHGAARARAADSLATWLEDHPDERVPEAGRDPDATAVLLATSGTTGTPKAAALTSHGLLSGVGRLALAPVGRTVGPRKHRDLLLAALPLTHVMGLSVALSGLCAGVPFIHRARFDAEQMLDLIEDRAPNVVVAVPTMYADVEAAGAAQRDLRSVQLWISAADVMPASRARRFQQYGAAARVAGAAVGTAAFADIYGMVELSGPAAIRLFPPSPIRPLSVPPVAITLPGVDVRAVDDDGVARWAQVGELQFRGPGVLRGYHGTDAPAIEGGWFATGDLGRVWPGGIFSYVGRTRDRLKVSGFSVFPAEVETELRRHPHVRDVALVAVPDERTGDRPVAVVVADGEFDADEFLTWAREQVSGYRRPRAVVTVDDLPRGNHGKVDRAAATELALASAAEASP